MARVLLQQPLTGGDIHVLDAGAGPGTLSRAVLAAGSGLPLRSLCVVESDTHFLPELLDIEREAPHPSPTVEVAIQDFIDFSIKARNENRTFTHVIMNPPYSKLNSKDPAKAALRHLGVAANNHYAAFMWLGIDLLAPGGRLVAVVPRSFTSGSHFRALRSHLFSHVHIEQITSFNSRDLFSRDSVLQEVIVISLRRQKSTGLMTEFASATVLDDEVIVRKQHRFRPDQVVFHDANGPVLIMPTDRDTDLPILGRPILLPPYSAHVGPIVAFRNREHIVGHPAPGAVPLIGSSDLGLHPREHSNYMVVNEKTSRFVRTPGQYVVIKRISPPEQSPRIRAITIDDRGTRGGGVAFENHVIYISKGNQPLSPLEAKSLLELVTHPATQEQFERLGSTTQVNVGDLYRLRIEERTRHL